MMRVVSTAEYDLLISPPSFHFCTCTFALGVLTIMLKVKLERELTWCWSHLVPFLFSTFLRGVGLSTFLRTAAALQLIW